MTDLVRRNTDTWTDVLPAVGDLATKISGTDFVPDAMRGKPAVVAAAILYGRELGMEPMTSLRSINVIKGKPALSAEAMRALILSAGHELRFVEMTATRCIIEGKRRGQDEPTRVSYSMDDAKKAGLAGQQQYSKMPRQMLAARATAELARLLFADVIGGLLSDVEAYETDTEPAKAAATVIRRSKPSAATSSPDSDPEPVLEDTSDPEPAPTAAPTDTSSDDDIIDAEILEDDDPALLLVRELGAETITQTETTPRGAALVREALKQNSTRNTPASNNTLKAMATAFSVIGVTDRDQRLTITRKIVGRDNITSAKDLSHQEASSVLDWIKQAADSGDPDTAISQIS